MKEKRRFGFPGILTGLMVLLLLLALSAVPSEATNYRLIIGAGHSRGAAIWVDRFEDFFAAEIKKRVEATTPHKIEWVTAWGGSVAKLDESLEAVQEGSLDFANIPYQFEPTKLFLHGWSQYMPFSSPDPIMTAKVANQVHRQNPYMTEVFEKQYNQKWLCCETISCYQMITNFPWKEFGELKGRKIAAAGANLLWLKGTGAVPVQSNLQEAYSSLQTGVYDGWIMFPEGAAGFKLYEVAKNYTLCDFGSVVTAGYTVNLKKWKSFPKEIQDIILKVSDEFVMDLGKAMKEKGNQSMEVMRKAGTNIYQFPAEEKMKWANSLANIADEKAKEADKKGMPGTAVMRGYLEGLEKEGYKWPRRWEIK